jgi:hypothetical protein
MVNQSEQEVWRRNESLELYGLLLAADETLQ